MVRQVLKTVYIFLVVFSATHVVFAQQETPASPQSAQFQQWLQSNGYAQAQTSGSGQQAQPVTTIQPATTQDQPPVAAGPQDQPSMAAAPQDPPTTSANVQPPVVTNPQANNPPPMPPMMQRPANSGLNTQPLDYEQRRKAMFDSLPPGSGPPNQDSVDAFNALLQSNMPLSPTQVVQLRQQVDLAQRAASIPATIPPKPVSSTLLVNLAPGTTPPAIRLAQGYVTSLVFVDSTGSPWPIAAFDIGNPKAVNLQWDGKSNVLMLQAVSPYSDGDVVVRLAGLPTPITLELVAGQPVVDYRVDLHVSGIGPNTKELPVGTILPGSANQLLLGVLDGIAPPGSKPLAVRGADCQAWLMGEKMYVRTRLTVLSPGWVGTMVSPDGMHAYELPKTSSILISRYGEPAELKVEGF
jgi:intracellular multiplication protein IcmK